MTRHYYDDEDVFTDDVRKDGEDGDVDGLNDALSDAEHQDTDFDNNRTNEEPIGDKDDIEVVRWESILIGDTVLDVCSTGLVRKRGDFFNVTHGSDLVGSPYRYVILNKRRLLMHELVWRAFHGEIPEGWEVRHQAWVPLEGLRQYPNDLSALEIYKITHNMWT